MSRLLVPAALISLAAPVAAEPFVYEIDPSHTVVSFFVDHVGYARVLGVFPEVSSSFTYDMEDRTLSNVEIRVGAASVETFDDARDEHVRAADFLDVAAFPEMTFTAEGGRSTGETTGIVEGELTLLSETRPLTLEVTLNKAEAYPFGHGRFTLGLSANATVRRSEYGMTYAVENGLVGDEVQVIIETEALRQE